MPMSLSKLPLREPQCNTREKIRWQLKRAINHCDRIAGNLQRIDELAADRNTQITTALPNIVAFAEVLKQTLTAFREEF